MSAEDNIVNGASGQAVQSLNILRGFDEAAGLTGFESLSGSAQHE